MKQLRIYLLGTMAVLMFSCNNKKNDSSKLIDEQTATLSEKETQEEWKVLFDGSDVDAWRGYLKDKMPTEWIIEGDVLSFTPTEDGNRSIITKKRYTNFVLSLEWKISKEGNSGIFYGVHEDTIYGRPYSTGPEIQVLDDERHPDAKEGNGTHVSGSLYDMIGPSEKVVKAAGEWNHCEISINHNTNEGSVSLNGINIVNFPVHGEGWEALVANSKFKDWKGFGDYQTGHIGLQDHGNKVWYRNIKIKTLD